MSDAEMIDRKGATTERIASKMRTVTMTLTTAVLVVAVAGAALAPGPPEVLPASAAAQLVKSLEAAAGHANHVWRDTPPLNGDGTLNGYVEISRGDRRKWEFDILANALEIDRIIPESIGGYPINYGFVPQTISYDGDPFDVLVLGPPLDGGSLVRGVIAGVMYMEDEKGHDSKVVISLQRPDGGALHALTERDRQEIGGYFRKYKDWEPGKFSKVPGWGSAEEGLAYVRTTHAFFLKCRESAGRPCRAA
jgi:inorganic pyrophosphatase